MLRSLLMRPVIEQLRRLAMTPALVNPVGQSAAGPPGVGVGVGVGLGVGEGVGVGTTITPSPGEATSSAPHPASASRAQPPSSVRIRQLWIIVTPLAGQPAPCWLRGSAAGDESIKPPLTPRSAERRGGKEYVSTGRSLWAPTH